jgi:hypothetical protein
MLGHNHLLVELGRVVFNLSWIEVYPQFQVFWILLESRYLVYQYSRHYHHLLDIYGCL